MLYGFLIAFFPVGLVDAFILISQQQFNHMYFTHK